MNGNTIEKVLASFGLTPKEIQIYLHLARHGVQGGTDIARKTKTAKAIIYRILKILQRKGFVESTLESPVRYVAIPFENILDLNIKSKHEEARQIETAKKDLLTDWSKISKGEPEPTIEKFTVIEGNQKIYSKIYQMIKETKNQLSIIASVQGIILADKYGVLGAIHNHPLRSKICFRFITDITNSELKAVKFLKKKLRVNIDLRGRNPELGQELSPRMVIRDQKEILFFTTPKPNRYNYNSDDTCLCTNCKSMVEAFGSVFEDLWRNSSDIEKKITEIETGKLPQRTTIICDAEKAKKQYYEALESAKREILIVTSSTGVNELIGNESNLKEWNKRHLNVRIMAPITTKNIEATHQLLQWCEVRHVPLGYFETTIIDGEHLFQFNKFPSKGETPSGITNFDNIFYTNEIDYIQKTKNILNDIWIKTRTPSSDNAESIITTSFREQTKSIIDHHSLLEKTSFMKNMESKKKGIINETDVLEKIKKEKKQHSKNMLTWKDTLRYFGTNASAIIHSPKNLNLPDLVFWFNKSDEDSSFGPENYIVVLLRETEKGSYYVPSAMVLNRPEPLAFRKAMLAGFPAENNIRVFKENEIQFRLSGNTFFAGWTRPIPLGTAGYIIPPSSVLFEGYDDIKSGKFNNVIPSGRRQEVWYNSLNAFVSYFHPQSKYVGSGTEGYVEKDWMLISKPP